MNIFKFRSKKNLDDTARLVYISLIEKIIFDKDVFDMFMHFKKNREFFSDIPLNVYLSAINDYINFMDKQNYEFSEVENRRIKKLNKLIKKYIGFNESNFKENDSGFYKLCLNILNNDLMFSKFIHSSGDFEGYSVDRIYEFIIGDLSNFYSKFEASELGELNNRIFMIERIRSIREKSSNEFNGVVDSSFEKAVMDNVSKSDSLVSLAYSIYNSLNSIVIYDSNMFALDQDYDDDYVLKIYDKKIDEISLGDSRVVCSNWAYLYSYFLNKNGIESYVVGNDKSHKYVYMLIGDSLLSADATLSKYSSVDGLNVPDLVRAKMGLKPAGFCYDSGKKIDIDSLDYKFNSLDFDLTQFDKNDEVSQLVNLIDENDIINDIFELDKDDKIKSVFKKLEYINQLVSQSNLSDNLEIFTYVRNLFGIVFDSHESSYVKMSGNLFKDIYKDCKLVPIVSVDVRNSLYGNGYDYLYFTLDEKKNFVSISLLDILKNVVNGNFMIGKHENNFDKMGLNMLNLDNGDLKKYIDNAYHYEYNNELNLDISSGKSR